jgi:O-antigen ligase
MLALICVSLNFIGSNYLFENICQKNEFILPILIFSLGFLVSINKSLYPLESLTAFLQILFIFLIAYPIIKISFTNEKHILAATYILVTTGLFIAIIMLIFYIVDNEYGIGSLIEIGWGGRLSYGGMEPNVPARILLQITPLCLVMAIRSRRFINKLLFTIFIAVLLLAVFLTASRSSLLIAIIGAIIFLVFYIKMGKEINIFYLILYIVIQYLLIEFISINNTGFYEKPMDRYSTILEPASSPSSLQRLDLIDRGLTYIDKNPIIGLGLENSNLYTRISIHNPIVLTWVENGFFGMIGFSGLYVVLLLFGLKCYKMNFFDDEILMGYVVVMVIMVIGDMFMANSYKRFLWIPTLLMLVRYRHCIFNIHPIQND